MRPVRSLSPERALASATSVIHQVLKDGLFTGRRFTSLPAAQRYADAIGGEVETL